MVWANPPPTDAAVRTYYSFEYRRDYKQTPVRTLPQIYHAGLGAIARYRAIAPLLERDGAVLDVGAGGGELVALLSRLGYDAVGVEPDESYSQAARAILGAPVRTGFVEDLAFPDGAFHAVLMYHVLEHMDRPVAMLARLRQWVAAAGFLLVEVPNIESRAEAPITRFHVAHLSYFSPETLAAVGRAAGYDVESIALPPDGGNITAIFRPRSGPPDRESPETLQASGAYRRITDILRAHTNLRYYTSSTPYARMKQRLLTYVRKRRIAGQFANGKQLLDALYRDIRREDVPASGHDGR